MISPSDNTEKHALFLVGEEKEEGEIHTDTRGGPDTPDYLQSRIRSLCKEGWQRIVVWHNLPINLTARLEEEVEKFDALPVEFNQFFESLRALIRGQIANAWGCSTDNVMDSLEEEVDLQQMEAVLDTTYSIILTLQERLCSRGDFNVALRIVTDAEAASAADLLRAQQYEVLRYAGLDQHIAAAAIHCFDTELCNTTLSEAKSTMQTALQECVTQTMLEEEQRGDRSAE